MISKPRPGSASKPMQKKIANIGWYVPTVFLDIPVLYLNGYIWHRHRVVKPARQPMLPVRQVRYGTTTLCHKVNFIPPVRDYECGYCYIFSLSVCLYVELLRHWCTGRNFVSEIKAQMQTSCVPLALYKVSFFLFRMRRDYMDWILGGVDNALGRVINTYRTTCFFRVKLL